MNAELSRACRPKYSAKVLLRMLLFAYLRKIFSDRRISEMIEENLTMRWLMKKYFNCPKL
ncbi:transposase [Companilactobacillus crustorum]|uniref:transposase n=1 Tax=Companilactobacillus crustorum TaxID=392416 RepID=UPI003AABF2DC